MHTLHFHLNAITIGISCVIALALFALSLAGSVAIVTRWKPDHFVEAESDRIRRRPVLEILRIAARNMLGVLCVVLGLGLSVPGVPGPGFAVIFIGATLIDFPRKRQLLLRLLRVTSVRAAIDRVRKRYSREPLILEELARPAVPPTL